MKSLRFALAQMNPAVGDYPGNAAKILSWIQAAEKKNADLIVFPECALSGYPVWDLANKPHFVESGLRWLDKIAAATSTMKVIAIVGFIDKGNKSARSGNCLAVLSKGRVIAKYQKRLLPTYDVFLEDIYFEPGRDSRVLSLAGTRFGLTICEDIWDEHYPQKPVAELVRKGAQMILNISASPYYRGVAEARDALIKRHVRQSKRPVLYVNQTGGQDDLIFDGRSLIADSSGRVVFRAPAFIEDLFFYDWAPGKQKHEVPHAPYAGEPEEVYNALVLGIRDYCAKNKFNKAVIGLSGGIDSALVAVLAVDALGPGAVLGVSMPGPYSSKGSWEDAKVLARRLGIEFRIRPIKKLYEKFQAEVLKAKIKEGLEAPEKSRITPAMENLQARLRGLELMYISNDESRLLLTTGNKSELAMGYCTLYGDMAGGLAAIGDVYKTDVYRLSWYRNSRKEVIPKSILSKPPSAELRPNQKDEDSLPAYEILDRILYLYIEKNHSPEQIVSALRKSKISPSVVMDTIRRVDHNEYKRRQTPPILRVTEKAWFGRRMPITNLYSP